MQYKMHMMENCGGYLHHLPLTKLCFNMRQFFQNLEKCNIKYAVREEMPNQNMYYEGYIIKYLYSKHNIDILPMGKVLLGKK